uniref:histidine--tRNA ligase n=1 Tax=Strombidinopsis acuminata TaxID=141414 RepID=A0A7S3RCG7_9SPIT
MCASGRVSAAVTQSHKAAQAGQKESLELNPPRGTRDFYPEEMRLRSWLFEAWRESAGLHGFEEYDAPVLESVELYERKAGEDVSVQLYNFEDKGGRRVTLRPEMTPSLARMVLGRRNALATPLKWFSIPQCWRYERTTRGRRREHYQWNMDIWGVEDTRAEAELLAAAVGFMKSVGLTSQDVGIKVSTRKVLSELLSRLGVPDEKFAATCVLVDKLDKLPQEEVTKALVDSGLSETGATDLINALGCQDFASLAQTLGSDSPALAELQSLFALAEAYGYSDWLVLDISVVRGLAYYTGTVFEGFDRSGELRAIFGGGRYDKLLSTFGGEDMPAAGFGFGDAVIVELLKAKNLMPDVASQVKTQIVVAPLGGEQAGAAAALASALRNNGVKTDLVLEEKKMKWIFKHCERVGAPYVVVLGSKEVESGIARVKCLADGEQVEVELNDLPAWMAKKE